MPASFLTLLAMLLAVGVAVIVAATWLITWGMLHPPRMTEGKALWRYGRFSPTDLDLAFEEVTFSVRDQRSASALNIAGWWIANPAAQGRCIVLLHGIADSKVGAIGWAPLLHRLGWSVLALDLRAHGQSGGRYSTAGFFERDDIEQVLDQWLASHGADARRVVLLGTNLGAVTAAAVAARRDDLAGAILYCPFADLKAAVAAQAIAVGLPGNWLAGWAVRWAAAFSSADFAAVRPLDLIPQIACPLLIILGPEQVYFGGGGDELASALARRAQKAGPSQIISAEKASALDALHLDETIETFLNQTATAQTRDGSACDVCTT